MRICIDMRPALSRATGVGVYLTNLIAALSSIDKQNEYHLFSSSWKERYHPYGTGPNFRVHDHRLPVTVLNYSWHRWSLPSIESLVGTELDVVHSPTPLLIPSKTAHRIITVHDLYFYKNREHTVREIRRDYPDLIRKHCAESDAIIAVSDYTRQQVIDLLGVAPSRIYTIRSAGDPFFAESVDPGRAQEVCNHFGVRTPYFLYTGSRDPRKNVDRLIEAFNRKTASNAQLVLAGPPGDVPVAGSSNIVETGYVSREELRALFRGATALVMPSLDEGFGLPLLEAMLAGVPVAASGIPAFKEVGADCFYSFDPNSIESIDSALQSLLSDSELRERLVSLGRERAAKFSWHTTATKTLELYQSL